MRVQALALPQAVGGERCMSAEVPSLHKRDVWIIRRRARAPQMLCMRFQGPNSPVGPFVLAWPAAPGLW